MLPKDLIGAPPAASHLPVLPQKLNRSPHPLIVLSLLTLPSRPGCTVSFFLLSNHNYCSPYQPDADVPNGQHSSDTTFRPVPELACPVSFTNQQPRVALVASRPVQSTKKPAISGGRSALSHQGHHSVAGPLAIRRPSISFGRDACLLQRLCPSCTRHSVLRRCPTFSPARQASLRIPWRHCLSIPYSIPSFPFPSCSLSSLITTHHHAKKSSLQRSAPPERVCFFCVM